MTAAQRISYLWSLPVSLGVLTAAVVREYTLTRQWGSSSDDASAWLRGPWFLTSVLAGLLLVWFLNRGRSLRDRWVCLGTFVTVAPAALDGMVFPVLGGLASVMVPSLLWCLALSIGQAAMTPSPTILRRISYRWAVPTALGLLTVLCGIVFVRTGRLAAGIPRYVGFVWFLGATLSGIVLIRALNSAQEARTRWVLCGAFVVAAPLAGLLTLMFGVLAGPAAIVMVPPVVFILACAVAATIDRVISGVVLSPYK